MLAKLVFQNNMKQGLAELFRVLFGSAGILTLFVLAFRQLGGGPLLDFGSLKAFMERLVDLTECAFFVGAAIALMQVWGQAISLEHDNRWLRRDLDDMRKHAASKEH
jgi:hypothetical protein